MRIALVQHHTEKIARMVIMALLGAKAAPSNAMHAENMYHQRLFFIFVPDLLAFYFCAVLTSWPTCNSPARNSRYCSFSRWSVLALVYVPYQRENLRRSCAIYRILLFRDRRNFYRTCYWFRSSALACFATFDIQRFFCSYLIAGSHRA